MVFWWFVNMLFDDVFSSFPHATDKTLLAKFKQQHQQNQYFVATPVMEPAFVILHFAGKVKYQIKVTEFVNCFNSQKGALYSF